MPSAHIATLGPSLPDVPTFLSDLSAALQGCSLSDLPHVTFPTGTFILVALPVNVAPRPAQPQAPTNLDQPGTGKGRSRKARRHTETQNPGPSETSTKMDGIVHQDSSHQSRHQQDEGKAYNMICDVLMEYTDLNHDQRTETSVTQPASDASQTAVKPSKSDTKSSKKPAADASFKRKTRCVATKVDKEQCGNKARVGFQTCGIQAHRRQDPKYESSDEAYSDSDA